MVNPTPREKITQSLLMATRLRMIAMQMMDFLKTQQPLPSGDWGKKERSALKVWNHSTLLADRIESDPIGAYDEGLTS